MDSNTLTRTEPSRRALLGIAASVAGAAVVATPLPARAITPAPATSRSLTPMRPSEVMAATIVLRAHEKAYREENEDQWHREREPLEDRFVRSRARDLRDLARKMQVVLFEDLLTDDAAHNAMVHVMAQLESWA